MRIVQFLPNAGSWGDVNPDTMKKTGLGGRETALVQLSELWARSRDRHEVINFVPTKTPRRYNYDSLGSSHYISANECGSYLRNFGADVCISWEEPKLFEYKEIRDNVKLAVIEMQVANLTVTAQQDAAIDYYAVLSQWAGEFLIHQCPQINQRKLVIFPNGVDPSRYKGITDLHNYDTFNLGRRNDPPEFYYSSSPDRGLHHLLRLWPRLREHFPGAKLHVCYGVEHWTEQIKWSHNMQGETALLVEKGLNQPGVVYHGRIGQDELAEIQQSCDALLYTCDTQQPTETGCITVIEACAAGTPAIITNADCLGSEFQNFAPMLHLPFNDDKYIQLVSDIITDQKAYEWYQKEGVKFANSRAWYLIAKEWLDFFEDCLNERHTKL